MSLLSSYFLLRSGDFVKRLFFRLLTLPMLWAVLAACAPHPDSAEVTGDTQTRIPVPQADGSYKMEIMQLTGLNNLFELSGQFAKFFLSPRVVDGRLDGLSPRGHFVKSGSLYVASDELSLQLTTIYAHMQKFAALDVELGAAGVNKWPRDIGVGVRITGGMTNNAFYDGETDAMLFVPYVGKDLPIPVNAGILAHEHFHSLFYKLVTLPLQKAGMMTMQMQGSAHSQQAFYQLFGLTEKGDGSDVLVGASQDQLLYHLLLIRGMNEGLADYWGWLYTNNANFIAKSLPTEGPRRNMEVSQGDRAQSLRLPEMGILRAQIGNWSTDPKFIMARINERAYTIGTMYSRIFKAYTDTRAQARGVSVDEARKDVARTILKTLPSLRNDLLAQTGTQFYEPSRLLASFAAQAGEMKKEECDLLAEVLNVNSRAGKVFSCEARGENFALTKSTNPVVIEKPATGNAAAGISFSPPEAVR